MLNWEPIAERFIFYTEILAGVSAISGLIWGIKNLTIPSKTYFPKSDNDFYEFYSSQISKAKKEVMMTSDGFNMLSKKSSAFSSIMEKGFSSAIKRGATIHRYQITESMNINWINELIKHKKKYGGNYRIYVNRQLRNISNICVIDSESNRPITESMEQVGGGTFQGSIAMTYIFRFNDKNDAHKKAQMFKDILDDPNTIELTTIEELKNLYDKIFSYRPKKLETL